MTAPSSTGSGFGRGRRWLALALALGLAALAGVLLLAVTELVFSLLERLERYPLWVRWGVGAALGGATTAVGWAVWRLLAPAGRPRGGPSTTRPPPSLPELERRLSEEAARGVETTAAEQELAVLRERQGAGRFYVALFGEISHGKSSLIRALAPAVEAEVDVRGGTTRRVVHYHWPLAPVGEVVLADVPGILLAGDAHQPEAVEEALRAHVVVFVCDGDLTADQWRAFQALASYGKPMVLAVNKVDRLRAEDLELILERLRLRVGADTPVVAVCSGGMEEVVRVLPDGREERITRERPADVAALRETLARLLAEQAPRLEARRDESILQLASEKLSQAALAHRAQTAQMLVERYTRRAVLGGMAAMAPGTDLVIQGALAVSLTRGLCQLYGVRVRDVDLDALFTEASRAGGRHMPLMLAVAGNALKAFPGMGTLAGGAAHAVAYGLIFQSLGRALARTLARSGALDRRRALEAFEEELNGDLGSRAMALAALALGRKAAREKDRA